MPYQQICHDHNCTNYAVHNIKFTKSFANLPSNQQESQPFALKLAVVNPRLLEFH